MRVDFDSDREICVVREISKKFETFHRGTLAEVSDYFDKNDVKGEIVIVIKGKQY